MKKTLTTIGLTTMIGLLANTANVFAANPYGINYTGGEALGADNVTINEALVDELIPLIDWHSSENIIKVSESNEWKDGYISRNRGATCREVKYLEVKESSSFNNLSFSTSNGKYKSVVNLNKITIEDTGELLLDQNDYFTVAVDKKDGELYVGYQVLTYNADDSTCHDTLDEHTKVLSSKDGSRIFLETNIKLYDNQANKLFKSKDLYYGIVDFDYAQSFEILNNGNEFSPQNMIAKSAESLQPTDSDLRNRFVSRENLPNYIYSEYDSTTGNRFDTPDISNLYVPISIETQEEGLQLVYGYGGYAGSRLAHYTKEYTVTYRSDEGGQIDGPESEDVISGLNPVGSEQSNKDGYEFVKWVVDKDVTLNDGTKIKAGEKITDAQITQIVVTEDLTITAIHKTKQYTVIYESDEGGKITGPENEKVNAGLNPVGSEQSNKDGYEFVKWVVDKDVTLNNGTEIKAGEKITDAQITQIVVNEDLKITAIHKSIPATPNTGVFTGDTNTIVISVSVLTIVAITTLIALLPKITHRKVSFKKLR